MTATLFVLKAHGGQAIGLALVCVEARYVSIRAKNGERLLRRFATPRDWRALEQELQSLPAGPMPRESAVARVLVLDGVTASYLTTQDITATIADVASVLDATLNAQPLDKPALALLQFKR